jgi:hypothetical protein
MIRAAPAVVPAALLAAVLAGCGGGAPIGGQAPPAPAVGNRASPYPVSPSGGTPATGPGERYNDCERIYCLVHGENFFVDHFLVAHAGWVLHDARRGDVFVPRHRTEGPEFPDASGAALRFCGSHVHPFFLGSGGGPVRRTGFNRTLGYGREHFAAFGTRLDPCCINGLGWGFLHSAVPRRFAFHDLAPYRDRPEIGWHRPFAARPR